MKLARIAIIIIIALSISVLSYAETSNITPANKSTGTTSKSAALQGLPGMKAERGVKNILFGWTDIPRSIIQVTRDTKNPLWGLTAGTFKGIGKAFPRTVSGMADVVSFPMGDYDKLPIRPDDLGTQVK